MSIDELRDSSSAVFGEVCRAAASLIILRQTHPRHPLQGDIPEASIVSSMIAHARLASLPTESIVHPRKAGSGRRNNAATLVS